MAEFLTPYHPMDKEYHEAMSEAPAAQPSVEEPIFPINEIGETVPEQDPTGRFKNMLQSAQAAMRGGAGTIQIVMMTPPESAIGGRPKAYGKEVREALREVAKANEVKIAGVELPTALNNLSGFDYQNLQFSEEKRQRDLEEVKDAIKFTADVAQGGGVDVVSWEFPRQIQEAKWNKEGVFEHKGEVPIGWVVDSRTGRTFQFRKTETQFLAKEPGTETPTGVDKNGVPILREWRWKDFKALSEKRKISPEEIYLTEQLESQRKTLEGWANYHMQFARQHQAMMKAYNEIQEDPSNLQKHMQLSDQFIDLAGKPELIKQRAAKRAEQEEERYNDSLHTVEGNLQQAKELKLRQEALKPIDKFAFEKSVDSYGAAGILAYDETYNNPNSKSAVHVGPEIGWPTYFGSHPDEFIALVKKARHRFVELATRPQIEKRDDAGNIVIDERTGKPAEVANPYFRGMSQGAAETAARKHIQGVFDTSHMGMWLAHFKPKPGENEDQRVGRFKKWYLEQVDKIAKADVVGGIQLVDSASAAHGHLPPGQGIFPVKEAAEIFKKNKFSGFLVSEGHEEEKFGEGRIRMKTWEHMGSPISRAYMPAGAPVRWGDVNNFYFGRTYTPNFIFGAYSPSNEFKLWSEVPFE